MLLVAVVLKFVPVIVTGLPTKPETGEKEIMVGAAVIVVKLQAGEVQALVPPAYVAFTRQ